MLRPVYASLTRERLIAEAKISKILCWSWCLIQSEPTLTLQMYCTLYLHIFAMTKYRGIWDTEPNKEHGPLIPHPSGEALLHIRWSSVQTVHVSASWMPQHCFWPKTSEQSLRGWPNYTEFILSILHCPSRPVKWAGSVLPACTKGASGSKSIIWIWRYNRKDAKAQLNALEFDSRANNFLLVQWIHASWAHFSSPYFLRLKPCQADIF